MDFCRGKLRLISAIMVAGMLAAVVWNGWQGWGLHRGYPHNTFLAVPEARFGDFIGPMEVAQWPTPYADKYIVYFPVTYVALRWLGQFFPGVVFAVVMLGSILGLVLNLGVVLRPVLRSAVAAAAMALVLILASYPLYYCVDRGNLELPMIFLISCALLLFRRRHYNLGLACLFFPICIKLYPALLLAPFCRRGHFHRVVIMGAITVTASLASALTFAGTLQSNLALLRRNNWNFVWDQVLHNAGLGGSVSLWNFGKVVWLLISPTGLSVPEWLRLYHLYNFLFAAYALVVVLFVLCVEREFFRKAVLLLLLMGFSAPNGGDYRLLDVELALFVFMLVPRRRRGDWLVAGMLAFALVPKREIILASLGLADTKYPDVSIGVLINAPLILVASCLLMKNGLGQWDGAALVRRGKLLFRWPCGGPR